MLTTSQLTADTKLKTTLEGVGLWDESKYANRTRFQWPGETSPKEPGGFPPLTQPDELVGGKYLPVGTIVTVQAILYNTSAYQCVRASADLPDSSGATGFLYTTHNGVDQVELYVPPQQPQPTEPQQPQPTEPSPPQPTEPQQPQPPEPPTSQPGDVQIEVHAGQTVVVEVKSITTATSSSGSLLGSPITATGLYTPEERREMAEGRVIGTPLDLGVAKLWDVQPGDILFRLGSRELARRIKEPVTHGGIYLGDGLMHDVVGIGNRSVRLVEFYAEADDPSVVKVVRFSGPLRDIIVARLVSNIRARNYDLPTDSIPWNLFSSAHDYKTATCLEYCHAQFLHAIWKLSQDRELSQADRSELTRNYFANDSTRPQALIASSRLRGSFPGVLQFLESTILIAFADILATDVDPAVFKNRWEGNSDESIESFTYNSFICSTRFSPVDPARTSNVGLRFKEQVFRIGPPVSTNVTGPIDHTVTRQTGIAWAEHSSGKAYLVQISIVNSSLGTSTQISFQTFVDSDLKDRAIARASLYQPRGIQSQPWNVISGMPSAPPPTAAQR